MQIKLADFPEFELFDIENAQAIEKMARENNKTVYSFKTSGGQNWLEKGFTLVDVLGLTVLSNDLPDVINLPDDEEN